MREKSKIYTFIGMSGVGKSHWSSRFQKLGFKVFPVDDLINTELGNLINKTKGDKNVKYDSTAVGDLARWMGFPGDKKYKANSKKYLKLESNITLRCAKEAISKDVNTILDTTGSIIYTDKKVLNFLKKHTAIIYFDTTEKNLEKMFRIFCEIPKPIIWGDIYKPRKGETEDKTLKRCYTKLLKSRIQKYKKLANVTIDYSWQIKKDRTVEQIYKKISN